MEMSIQPEISVIISTYNAPRWLELVLEGYLHQSFDGAFEIVVADDGSTDETAQLIERMSALSPIPISHVWQPDDGFQKCRILNKAIAQSRAALLLFTDGDCVPQPHMVETHVRRARPGTFLTGAYLKLPEALSHSITVADIHAGRVFQPGWLIRHGFKQPIKLLKWMLPPPIDRIANRLTPTKRTWNGHNASCFRVDALTVNGFNESMQYGGEDVEFGLRLNHAGVLGRHLRFSTMPVHLFHRHGYVVEGMIERSRDLLRHTRRHGLVRIDPGLDQWL